MATSPLIPSTLPPREGCACEGCDNPGCHFGGCQGRKPIVRRTVTYDPELLPLPPGLTLSDRASLVTTAKRLTR